MMGLEMPEKKLSEMARQRASRWVLVLCGIALAVWQFFTFMDVVQLHTAQAQSVSRSASWAGQPVGTTPQLPMALEASWTRATPPPTDQTGMMRAVAP